jgi:uncharacterized protein (DUF302 family)
MKQATYGIRTTVPFSFEEATAKTKTALAAEGFGVLSEIDMKAKLKEKLGVDYRNYVILGACNPPLAFKALQAEPEIGLLLPCNVIVYESGPGQSVVSAIDPQAMLGIAGGAEAVREVAADARRRLEKALANIR